MSWTEGIPAAASGTLAEFLAVPGGLPALDDRAFPLVLDRLAGKADSAHRPAAAEVLGRATLTPAQLAAVAADFKAVGERRALTVRVQNVSVSPLCSVSAGVSSQLLIVFAPEVLLKFAAMYELVAPE